MGKISPPALTNETIQQRLLTGASIRGGARGSLTRCAAKLGVLNSKLTVPGGSTDQEIQAVKEDIKREIQLFKVEMKKWMIMIKSQQRELQEVSQQEQTVAAAVTKKQQDIQELRNQTAKVARTRKCWQEYENLAKLACQRNPRRLLQQKLDKANADLEKTKRQLRETAAESKIREKQFHLLIQCMLDLKRSLGEPVELPPEEGKAAANKEKPEEQQQQQQPSDKASVDADAPEPTAKESAVVLEKDGIQPMETENYEEEEDDLYDGL